MNIIKDLINLAIIAQKYDLVSDFEAMENGVHVYVSKSSPQDYMIIDTDYLGSFAVSFIRTNVRSQIPFLISKHCSFIKVENSKQLEQLIQNKK